MRLSEGAWLLTALTGGLAGSIITLFGRGFVDWWNRPILAIVFNNGEPGCRVRTRSVGGKTDYSYLRLKIENRGNTYAKGTAVCVTHLSFCAVGSREKSFEEEVFDLGLALSDNPRPVFDLGSKAHRFLDLAHVALVDGKQHPKIYFNFLISAVRLSEFGFDQGDYQMTIIVTAENAKSEKRIGGLGMER